MLPCMWGCEEKMYGFESANIEMFLKGREIYIGRATSADKYSGCGTMSVQSYRCLDRYGSEDMFVGRWVRRSTPSGMPGFICYHWQFLASLVRTVVRHIRQRHTQSSPGT